MLGHPPPTCDVPLKDRGNIPTNSDCGVQTSKEPSSLTLRVHKAETRRCLGLIDADGLVQEHQQRRQGKT